MRGFSEYDKDVKGKITKSLKRYFIALFFAWTALSWTAQAEEVIEEIRFQGEGFASFPCEGYFRVIDIRGNAHRIDVKATERIEILNSMEYKGPKQYATDYRGYTYKRVRVTGRFYHWFFIPGSCAESSVETEINRMIHGR